jgi:hypothetical protein
VLFCSCGRLYFVLPNCKVDGMFSENNLKWNAAAVSPSAAMAWQCWLCLTCESRMEEHPELCTGPQWAIVKRQQVKRQKRQATLS